MKPAFRVLVLGALSLLPVSAALATAPSVSPISDITVNAGITATVNVVASDADADPITLTASLPPFATLNPATPNYQSSVTTVTLSPQAGDVGSHAASITATAGSESDTEEFQIAVAPEGSDQAPVVTAPPLYIFPEGEFLGLGTIAASDADGDLISLLAASGLPSGATFTSDGTNTSGFFAWTPNYSQAGHYDVTFEASNSLTGSATTHLIITNVNRLIHVAPIENVTIQEGATVTVDVAAIDPDSAMIELTWSLPTFATLNPPTTSSGTDSLGTTITIAPGLGTAGTYDAYVTASTGSGATYNADTEPFTITVTSAGGGDLTATADLIGNFNPHRRYLCFRIRQHDTSFDLKSVMLGSLLMRYQGATTEALEGKTHFGFECDGDCDGDCDDHGDMEGDDGNCDECDHEDDCNLETCEVEEVKICFTMDQLEDLLGDSTVGGNLPSATIEGLLTTGGNFVATIQSSHSGNEHADRKGNTPLKLRARPNPLNPKTDISYTLTMAGQVRVAIFDLQGRLVRTLVDGNRGVGAHVVTWDGTDANTERVASGVYFARIQAVQGEAVTRVSVLK